MNRPILSLKKQTEFLPAVSMPEPISEAKRARHKRRRNKRALKLYKIMLDWMPVFFDKKEIKPLKIGIYADILARPDCPLDAKNLSRFLAAWCNRPAYKKALSEGVARQELPM